MDDDPRVRLWVVPASRRRAMPGTPGCSSAASLELLDRSERERAASFHHEEDRVRYQRAHVALREVLAEELGVAPADIAFGRQPCPRCGGPHGRPILTTPPAALHFSLAASGDVAAIALGAVPVGVDVERVADAATVEMVGELLHPEERAEIRRARPARRAQAFTVIWTRKEAFRKVLGEGLADDLAREYVGTDTARPAFPAGWQITSVPVAGPYEAAVAVSRTGHWPGDREIEIVASVAAPL